ncbi:AAA family ATPase [Streptomyces umbrinus]
MAIRSFDVQNLRGLRRAAAEDLPNLVAISGPNGSGKSSLLEQLKSQTGSLEPGTELLYVGPHRTWRSSQLNEVAVVSLNMTYENILKQDTMPSVQYPFANLHQFAGLPRKGTGGDDAQAFVKSSILRIRNKQQTLLGRHFKEQGGKIDPGTVPDLFGPFSELVSTLLPHLEWVGVNDENLNDMRCEFRSTGIAADGRTFDIDEMSSGEKAAISLFLPFIERQVAQLSGESAPIPPTGVVPLTVLLDEPELHLHPLLQINVLEYMRTLAREGRAQFIFTVHSPSLLDALTKDELFLLSPADLAADNQLSRLVDTTERLEAVRSITGSTHMLTRCKPIVFIEGEPDDGAKATDERLIRLLLPDTSHWALVPSRGKSQVIKSASEMRHSEIHLPGLPVFGLVDDDQGGVPLPDFVVAWPVTMVENLLLDEEALYEVIRPYMDLVGLRSSSDVRTSLLDVAMRQVEEEKRLRLKEILPRETLAIGTSDLSTAQDYVQETAARYLTKIANIDLRALSEKIDVEVQEIIDNGGQLEHFHGKKLLRAWYDVYFSKVGIGWNPFLIELSRYAAGTSRIARIGIPAIDRIRLYFPATITTLLESCPEGEVRGILISECARERENWENGFPTGAGRDALRQRIIQYTRENLIEESIRNQLLQAATGIGTP